MARTSRKQKTESLSHHLSEQTKLYQTAIYARLSVEDNGKDSESIESQISLIESYILAHPDFVPKETFIDNGYTGTNFERPAFQRMLEAVRRGEINCVIVKDLSRLGRNYVETGEFLEKICPFLNLRFISLSEGFDTASMSSNGELAVSLSNIVNDYYAKDISRKVTSALRTKMEKGDYIGNYAPYGYRKDPSNKNHLLIDEETAPIVRRIFAERAGGKSCSAINRMLNKEGILSPSELKKRNGIKTNFNQKEKVILWNKHMLTIILNNIVYIGHLAQRKGSQCLYAGIPYHVTDTTDWIVTENTHQPIIDTELFEKVQKINRESSETVKQSHGKYDHLPKEKNLYGGKLVCADCGATMKLHRSFNTKKTKVYFTFNCPTYNEHGAVGCSGHKKRKSELDEAVLGAIKAQMALFMDESRIVEALLAKKRALQNTKSNQRKMQLLAQDIKKVTAKLTGLYIDLKEGLLTEDEYLHYKTIYQAELDRLEMSMKELKKDHAETENSISGTAHWSAVVKSFSDADRITEELLDACIERITVSADGSLNITFQFMQEFTDLFKCKEVLQTEVA